MPTAIYSLTLQSFSSEILFIPNFSCTRLVKSCNLNVTCQENCLLNGIVSTEKCKIFHWPDGCKYSQNLGAHPKYAVTPSGKGSSQLSCSVQIMKIIVLDTVICSFRNENMLRLNKSDPFVPTRPRVESFSSL